MKAKVFRIINNTDKAVILWPLDKKLRKYWAIYIPPNCIKIMDFNYHDNIMVINFDECYFSFYGMKKKINPKEIHKHGVFLEIYE